MQRALSFKNSPPLSVPLRFLITAPIFAFMAALLLLWAGPSTLSSRWHGSTLALTHFFTLGVLANAMAGALLQILPVAAGIRPLAPRISSWIVHSLLNLGTLALAAGFLQVRPALFGLAAILLFISLIWLTGVIAASLWRDRRQATKGSREILAAVRLALIALIVTITLGLVLTGSMALSWPLPRQLTDLHGTWGLAGWVGLLTIGIAYQVIPMFQVTELYPQPVTRWLTLGLFIVLLGLTVNTLLPWTGQWESRLLITIMLLAGYLIFAAVTFDLLRQRKRPKPDTTTLFWYAALASLAACIPVWLLHIARVADLSVLLGLLFIVGFGWSAVNGMLYKIIPFLLWYNAQKDLTVALRAVPKVKHFIPDTMARPQFHAHWITLALLILACLRPQFFSSAAALSMIISTTWLIINIIRALRLYYTAGKEISRALAARSEP